MKKITKTTRKRILKTKTLTAGELNVVWGGAGSAEPIEEVVVLKAR